MQKSLERPAFGKWRNRLWPFHRHELKKIVPLILMKFFVSVVYCILLSLKDTITVTTPGSGAEVILVLKNFLVFPAAIFAAFCYSSLSNYVKKSTLFYITASSFLLILFCYAFILSPNASLLSPQASADWLLSVVGEKNSYWISVYRNWFDSLFFVIAELWGSVMILVVFWGFANDITTVSEAKRSYTVYIAAGDLAAACVGPIVVWVSHKFSNYDYLYTVQCLTAFALLIGLGTIALYFYMQKYVLTDPRYQIQGQDQRSSPQKQKERLSFVQGIKHLITSPYLLGISILVIAYGLCISLVEISWKANLKIAYPNSADFQAFTATCHSMVGIIAFFISAFFGSSMMRRFGWNLNAQLTPIIVGGAGVLFLLLCSNTALLNGWIAPLFGISPLFVLIYSGAFHNVISKVAKYAFFDPTKEMTYIPLSDDEKVKGKAAIEVVGSRLGKSGASNIQILIMNLAGTGSVLAISKLLLPIVTVATVGWMYSVRSLSRKFTEKTDAQAKAISAKEPATI